MVGKHDCVCSVCGKGLANKYRLDYHMLMHTGTRQFGCGQCNKRFMNKHIRNTHIKLVHHGTRSKQTFQCDICKKSYQTRWLMQQHQNTHFGESLIFSAWFFYFYYKIGALHFQILIEFMVKVYIRMRNWNQTKGDSL